MIHWQSQLFSVNIDLAKNDFQQSSLNLEP